jgi:hypothetical protein
MLTVDEFRQSLTATEPPMGLTLHRKEGDQTNAAYWYSRAGKPVCGEPLDVEWLSIVTALLG